MPRDGNLNRKLSVSCPEYGSIGVVLFGLSEIKSVHPPDIGGFECLLSRKRPNALPLTDKEFLAQKKLVTKKNEVWANLQRIIQKFPEK